MPDSDPRDPSSSDEEFDPRAEFDERPLHEQLGTKVEYLPDEDSPPIDERRLLAYVRNQMPADEREEIIYYLAHYRPWVRAFAEVVRRDALGAP